MTLANFKAHIAGAALCSGTLASLCYNAQLTDITNSIILWITGILAGILPDIDSKNSHSVKVIFNTISLSVAVLITVCMTNLYPLLWIWACVLAACITIRWAMLPLFKKITIHRGNWHSLLTCLCVGISTINITWHTRIASAEYAWLLGLFVVSGFFTHLLIDEICAFNFLKLQKKRSFGTAIKPINISTPFIALSITILFVCQFWYLPPWQALKKAAYLLASSRFYY